MSTPLSNASRPRNRKRETEEGSPSTESVLGANLKETPPMEWRDGGLHLIETYRHLGNWRRGWPTWEGPVTEEDFKPQRVKIKRGSTSAQTWELDVGKEWVTSQHQRLGKQIASDAIEKGLKRKTARSWWMALDTMKELESCLKVEPGRKSW